MTIYEVSGIFFTDLEQAELHALGTHYKIKHHWVNDSENLEVERDGLDVYIIDENNNKTEVEYSLHVRGIPDYFYEKTVMIHDYENIKVKGFPIETAAISDRLKEEIEGMVQSCIDDLNDETL